MCGIAGIFDLQKRPVGVDEIRRMTRVIAHRGPDGEGIHVDHEIGLGHRRLAIIDLSDAARQPMTNEDDNLSLIYNGEIYNFRELTRELVAKGHRFASRTDSEVILHLYEEEGEDCLLRLNGMFAFALWDRRRRRLLLARDRFGVKPLYYGVFNGRLLFGSEIKAILAADGIKRELSLEAFAQYFTFQNTFSSQTLFQGVRLLPPGHLLVAEGDSIVVREYWDVAFEPSGWTLDESAERVRVAFEDAVQRQLVSDVPVGCYLSGGMDSASIVGVSRRHIPRIMTFTGGFDLSSVEGLELAFDERKDAELVASHFKSEHYEMVLHSGDLAWCLPRLIWHLEDLRVGMSYQNYYVARLASRFVKVVLAGVGGDELFAGYPWRYRQILECRDEDEFDQQYYRYWSRLLTDKDRAEAFAPKVAAAVENSSPFEHYREILRRAKGLDPLSRALYFELKTFLHGLLVVEDKLTMAHSLESRVPFLDDELVAVAARVPSGAKMIGDEGKAVLRRAMRDLLPANILARPKQGFSAPDASWYRGETMSYICEILLDARTLDRGYFKPDFLRRILSEHLGGKINHRLLIWSLLSFEWWNRLFLDGMPPPTEEAPRRNLHGV